MAWQLCGVSARLLCHSTTIANVFLTMKFTSHVSSSDLSNYFLHIEQVLFIELFQIITIFCQQGLSLNPHTFNKGKQFFILYCVWPIQEDAKLSVCLLEWAARKKKNQIQANCFTSEYRKGVKLVCHIKSKQQSADKTVLSNQIGFAMLNV